MVLPLLGLLGAGLASTAALRWGSDWFDRRQENALLDQRSERTRDALGGLLEDPNAGQFDFGSALLQGGLLSAGDFMSTAFDQENQLGKFGLDQMLAQAGADRDAAKLQEGRLFDLGSSYQPRFDALEAQRATLADQDQIISQLLGMSPAERDSFLGTKDGIALMNRLAESEERGFSAYKQEVYGTAEPNPEIYQRLRDSYFGALGGGYGEFITKGGRLEQARDVLDQRVQELGRRGQVLQREYQRNQDRVTGGGVPRVVGPEGGVGLADPAAGVTMSGRNAGDAVGARAMAIGEALVGAGEVPDREQLTDFLTTGGQSLDPVTTAWCAAFVNAAIARAGGQGTGSLAARSFLDWGSPVDDPAPGDLAIFSRGNGGGHVGFFRGRNPDGSIRVLGGNQGNSVRESNFPAAALLGFRRG